MLRQAVKAVLGYEASHRTHSEVLSDYLGRIKTTEPIIIEVGLGLTSGAVASFARSARARYYACDLNADLVQTLERALSPDGFIQFRVGKSEEVLRQIVSEVPRIDFAFLDGAPSAMTTFREFSILEPRFESGAILVLDNAAVPGERQKLRTPCRKGKILVPYLLASPFWEVIGLPNDGDSMVAALKHAEPDFADSAYEDIDGSVTHDVDRNWLERIPQP